IHLSHDEAILNATVATMERRKKPKSS
ncbi:hypothetical protein A2U01_0111219, partial [Trifolium medium]|nr:hypothetical protein [Trifolium medium]